MRLQVTAGILAMVLGQVAGAETLVARPPEGRIVVNVFKAGLFSAFAHDHHFAVGEWSARAEVPEVNPAGGSVEVVIAAGSLHDLQASLSDADRRKVDAQAAGKDVLDAAEFPRIEFRSERIELSPGAAPGGPVKGTVHGTLTVRGRPVPVEVPFEAERTPDGWSAHGAARLAQSALGIKPFSGFGGTVKVKDELTIDFAITLRRPGG
jgi:polyisoprenoid-binding protein YceI